MINVRFVRDDVVLGYCSYADPHSIPDLVTLGGVPYGTTGTDETGRTASHSGPHDDGSGEVEYIVRVVDVYGQRTQP